MTQFRKSLLAAAFGLAALAGTAHAADGIVVASKIDTEGALLGNIIVDVLEHAKLPVVNKVSLGPTKVVRGALTSGAIDNLSRVHRQRRLLLQRRFRSGLEKPGRRVRKGEGARRAEQARLAGAGARQQHLGDFGPQGPRRCQQARHAGRFRQVGRRWRQGEARRLGGVRRKRGGAARLPGRVRLQADGRPAARALGRRHLGDREGRGRADFRRQRCHGLRHRRPARRARPRRPHRHQGCAGRVRAGAVVRAEILDKYPQIKDLLEPVFKSLTLETLQDAQRQDRRRWRGRQEWWRPTTWPRRVSSTSRSLIALAMTDRAVGATTAGRRKRPDARSSSCCSSRAH